MFTPGRFLLLAPAVALLALPGCGRSAGETGATAAVRKGVALTVYSDDFAQVRVIRCARLSLAFLAG